MKKPSNTSKSLKEITNTPKSRKTGVLEPEKCIITNDEEILDLNLVNSDDDIFGDIMLENNTFYKYDLTNLLD